MPLLSQLPAYLLIILKDDLQSITLAEPALISNILRVNICLFAISILEEYRIFLYWKARHPTEIYFFLWKISHNKRIGKKMFSENFEFSLKRYLKSTFKDTHYFAFKWNYSYL